MKNPVQSRVLLVEDDEAVRRCLAGVLAEAGYHVASVADAAAAIRTASAEPFSAVLCDQHLGRARGTDVLREILGVKPAYAARFLLMSGGDSHDDDDRARAFAETRPERYLRKPFTNDDLLAALARTIAATTVPAAAR